MPGKMDQFANGVVGCQQEPLLLFRKDAPALPNVTPEQQKAAKSLTAKDVTKIIEQANVRTPRNVQNASQNASRSREHSPQSPGRER